MKETTHFSFNAVVLVMVRLWTPARCTNQYAGPNTQAVRPTQRSNQRARRNYTNLCAWPQPAGQYHDANGQSPVSC